MSHIYLYGPPGSGKSTIGKILAKRLNMNFIDIDSVIVATAGCEIAEIFKEQGEEAFRDLETKTIADAAEVPAAIIALGGGALLRSENRSRAESSGSVLCFTADNEILLQRIRSAPGQRPLADESDQITERESPLLKLLTQRKAHYESFKLTLKVSNSPVEETTDNAQMVLGRYWVSGMGTPYNVYVGPGVLERTGELFQEEQLGERAVIVGDSNTIPLYASVVAESLTRAGVKSSVITIPAGEEHKTIDTVGYIWKGLMRAGVERSDTVIALGGGVTGDLTGFAASTWLRGVKWISAPTTLLAMCDSGLGGKTGADLPEGKNLIGAFHPPALVIADTCTLATLPAREIRCGLAETIKHAIIDDSKLLTLLPRFDFCRTLADTAPCASLKLAEWLPGFVARSMAVKIRIITQDPYEKGVRAALNLGHTIGHGIEKATNFAVQHGEAVAIGTVLEAKIAVDMQLADKELPAVLAGYFASAGLPTSVPEGLNINAVMQAITLDKKKAGGKVRFALPATISDVRTGIIVDDNLLEKTISH